MSRAWALASYSFLLYLSFPLSIDGSIPKTYIFRVNARDGTEWINRICRLMKHHELIGTRDLPNHPYLGSGDFDCFLCILISFSFKRVICLPKVLVLLVKALSC